MATTKQDVMNLVADLTKEGYIDIEGKLGYVICETAADPFNGYQAIGKRVLALLEKEPQYEEMIAAITGKTLADLKQKIREESKYYDSLNVDN